MTGKTANRIESLLDDLGEKERLFIRQGTAQAGKSRSQMIQSLAVSAVNRGWTREEFHAVMLSRSNKGTAKIFEKPAKGRQEYIDRCWDKAIDFVRRNPPISNLEDARRQIRAARAAIDRMDWSYSYGSIHYAVLIAHFDIAEKLGRLEYAASIRRISEKAGVTKDTVMNAQDRLTRFVIPQPVPVAQTSRWKLITVASQDSNYQRTCEEYCPDQRSGADHDVWHQWGLGKGAWRIWNVLSPDLGMNSDQLSKHMRSKPRTTTCRLKRLQRSGLARSSGSNWYRVDRDLDEVAAELGTFGRLAKRRTLHADERLLYETHRQIEVLARPGSGPFVISEQTKSPTLRKRESTDLRTEPAMLEAALSYAQIGFRVLPLHSIVDGRCTCAKSCRTPGKHPIGALVPRGSKEASREVRIVQNWWTLHPFANVGIATGLMANGLYLNVIDVDPRNGGNDTFEVLIAVDGLPDTALSRTGGGGNHWLLSSPEPLRNSCALGRGIDFKGEGGYIVAPPSRHESGSSYEWIRPVEKLEPMPKWLLKKLLREEDSSLTEET